jgi:hypothetical protein
MKPTDEEKKKILEKLEEALDNGSPFMILTASSPEAAVMMAGEKHDVAQMLTIAMSKIPELEEVVKVARKALKSARRNRDRNNNLDSELLKCNTCDKREECDIRSIKEKAMREGVRPEDIMELLKHLSEKHGQIVSVKPKGDC